MTRNATCKFCGSAVVCEFDDGGLVFFDDVDALVKLAACNWCADHRMKCIRFADSARQLAGNYVMAFNAEGAENQTTAALRSKLEGLSKRFVTMVARHYRLTNYWDSGWTDMLCDDPQKAYKAMMVHDSQMRRKAAQTETATTKD